jgi:3-methyladenine DNA glycosylase AlkD
VSAQKNDKGWLAKFDSLVAKGDIERALALLESRATAHAGTPPAADKRAAAKSLAKRLSGKERWKLTKQLAKAESATRRELACLLLADEYESHRDDAQTLMVRLADDAHWEVRLWAGGLFDALLARHFDELLPVYEGWRAHESQFVRLAVATGVMSKEQAKHPKRAKALLGLVEPLLSDRAHEVERNLGPFAIGAALLRMFPDETLRAARRWSRWDDEQVRWNTAMVFSAAEARKHTDVALEVLAELARDQRRKVQMAVSMALRNLAKGDAARVLAAARPWLADERKLPASLGLRGMREA